MPNMSRVIARIAPAKIVPTAEHTGASPLLMAALHFALTFAVLGL